MRFHKAVVSSDLVERGPAKLAMMVASEFWRARAGAEFRDEAVRALWRARELMGVLETVNLPQAISNRLLPYYRECRLPSMFADEQLAPQALIHFSDRLGNAFDQVARDLA